MMITVATMIRITDITSYKEKRVVSALLFTQFLLVSWTQPCVASFSK